MNNITKQIWFKSVAVLVINAFLMSNIAYSAPGGLRRAPSNLRQQLISQKYTETSFLRKASQEIADISYDNPFKLLIFDADSTLYQSEGLHSANKAACYQYAFEQLFAQGVTMEDIESKRNELNSMTGMLRYYGLSVDDYYDYLAKTVDPSQYLEPDKNLRELLQRLRKKFKITVVTNNGTVFMQNVLMVLGIDDLFEAVMTQQKAGIGKPNPKIFELACRDFGISTHQAVSIGDRQDIDLDSAANVGIEGILVKSPQDVVKNLEDRLDKLSERTALKGILTRLANGTVLYQGELGYLGYLILEDEFQRNVFGISYMNIEGRLSERVDVLKSVIVDDEVVHLTESSNISLIALWNFYIPLAKLISDRQKEDFSTDDILRILINLYPDYDIAAVQTDKQTVKGYKAFWSETIEPLLERYKRYVQQERGAAADFGTGFDFARRKEVSILLVDPHYRKDTIYGPPLGLAYIASQWKKYGKIGTVDFDIQGDISTLEKFRKAEQGFFEELSLKIAGYDIVGITVTAGAYPRALQIAKIAKAQGKIVILGGSQITLITSQQQWRDRIFNDADNSADILVMGEGDKVMPHIAEHLMNNNPLRKIDGISYRIADKYFFNRRRKLQIELDELPFPSWELFNFRTAPKVAFLSAGRGCPNKCSFCDERIIMPGYKFRSVESIMQEIEHNASLGIRHYRISDSTFSAYPYLEELLDEIMESNLNIKFVAYARVDDISKKRYLLPKLKKAGMALIYIGVESGSQRVLDRQNKGTTLEEIEEVVRLCKMNGIRIKGSFILGLVGDKEEDIMQTIAFAKKLDLSIYSWHILAPSIGSLRQVPGYSDIDWKYVDTDVPDNLIPEIAAEKGDKARNLMVERHTAFKIDSIPDDLPKHISGFTFKELYGFLKLAISETKQNSQLEATYLFSDVDMTALEQRRKDFKLADFAL